MGSKKDSLRKAYASATKGIGDSLSDIQVTMVNISELTRDARLQMRASQDSKAISDYAAKMVGKNSKGRVIDPKGNEWPPIKVVDENGKLWVNDGFHRLDGAEEAGLRKFQCAIRKGTYRDAFEAALDANEEHDSIRLTNKDKNRKVVAHLKDEIYGGWTNSRIAQKVGVTSEMVGQKRAILIEEEIIPYRGLLEDVNGNMRPAGQRKTPNKKASQSNQLPEATLPQMPTIRRNDQSQPLKPKEAPKEQSEENSFDLVDNQTSNPQDDVELPYNPVDITPPKAEPKNEVTQEPVVYGNPGNWLMRDAMKKSDWTSLAGLLTKKQAQTFIAPAPHQSPHMSDPLQWVAKYTGALAGRVFKQVIIVGRKVYFVWSSNDLELPTVFDSEEHLSKVLEAART